MTTGFLIVFVMVALLIVAVAIAMLVVIVRGMRGAVTLQRVGVDVQGTVTDNQTESRLTASDGSGMSSRELVFRPVVRFVDRSGQEVTAVATNVSRRSFVAGTSVQLKYDPANPDRVKINDGSRGRGGIVMIMFLLVFAAAVATMVIFAVHTFGNGDNAPSGGGVTGCPQSVCGGR